tara:strand:+ start:616 stop:1257 length:642 start_codon:yes stop_codon:yes gene_type:complete
MTIRYEECPAFPVRFFKFHAPKNLTDETLEKIKKIEFHALNQPAGVGTSYELQNNEEFLPIHKWFQECIDSIHKNERYHCDRLVVNKSWANRSDAETGHRHDFHRHPMSYLSGIFYLTKGAPTIFLDPVKDREWGQFHLDGYPDKDCKLFSHLGPGGLMVFPSYVIHGSEPNYDKVDRYSIAFNTFPQGNFQQSGHGDEYMCNVTVNNVGDYL